MTIRPATSDDHDRMVALDAATWGPLTTPAPRPTDVDLFARRRPADHLVAEVDGEVVGYVVLGAPTPLPSNRHVMEIQGLAVHPDATGRGVGAALVQAAIAEARRRGARKVRLRVLGHNTRARRLYERAGFVIEGVLVGEFMLDGIPIDDVLMALHLDEPAPGPSGQSRR
jgi:ribosomal protein S18 acetylase RimI-like enzyme